jgi:hypothetical protein
MTSAWMAGADVPPAAAPIPAPAPAAGAMMAAPIGYPIGGCNGCGNGCGAGCSGSYDECPDAGGRPNLFSKLRAKFGHGGGCNSCGPVYTGFTTAGDTCGGCGKHGGGLFSRWKGKSSGSCCGYDLGSGYSVAGTPAGCALPLVPGAVVPAPAVGQPAPMPMTPAPKAPEQPKTDSQKKTTRLTVPPVATPVSAPKGPAPRLGGSGSPF